MSESNEIRAELFGPTEQRLRIFATVGAPTAQGRFFVNADAMEEDGTPVQQNVSASGLDTAKADLISYLIRFAFDYHVIELRILRRPQLQIRVEIDLSKSASIRVKGFTDPRLRNPHGNS